MGEKDRSGAGAERCAARQRARSLICPVCDSDQRVADEVPAPHCQACGSLLRSQLPAWEIGEIGLDTEDELSAV